MYSFQQIATIINAKASNNNNCVIEYLLTDSRKIILPNTSLFFALKSNRRDGHTFIKDVYDRNVKCFVVDSKFDYSNYSSATFLVVDDVLKALQILASAHRQQFDYNVIGITGSNGKTIVKEWLNELLSADYNIVRSPRSYNSQIGVPLSVWQMNSTNNLAIFEAGISAKSEMQFLQKVIQPTIGILTNIGTAHSEGFLNNEEKLHEKLLLFKDAEYLVAELETIANIEFKANVFSWSKTNKLADIFVENISKQHNQSTLNIIYQQHNFTITIPFIDDAYINNIITCITVLLLLGLDINTIESRLQLLQSVDMRLQLKNGVNNCCIINDSYSNDLSSLNIAIDYLKQQSGNQKTTLILSDIFQSGIDDNELYSRVAEALKHSGIKRFIGIGKHIGNAKQLFENTIDSIEFYTSTENFLRQTTTHHFTNEFVLLKGARVFEFERIANRLSKQIHQTILEINLTALAKNLKIYQQHILPTTKIMAMVKAYGYGSGSAEVARVLEYHKVDYLAVAYADEGVELRKAGIALPIMVMNIDEDAFDTIIEHNLEPEIYSFSIYNLFNRYLQKQAINQFPVHVKVNTGMNRLGFEYTEALQLATKLNEQKAMIVQSCFTHLAASEDANEDEFTMQQTNQFDTFCNELKQQIGYNFLKHVANSAAIFRHQKYQYNMVRLGIGLYGVDSANMPNIQLENVATFKTTIAQIRNVESGNSIGYNRKGVIEKNSKIATIRIGYADGLSRQLGNRNGYVFVRNKMAKIVGNVCMDMTMIDVTDINDIMEDDEVEIFGKTFQ